MPQVVCHFIVCSIKCTSYIDLNSMKSDTPEPLFPYWKINSTLNGLSYITGISKIH